MQLHGIALVDNDLKTNFIHILFSLPKEAALIWIPDSLQVKEQYKMIFGEECELIIPNWLYKKYK